MDSRHEEVAASSSRVGTGTQWAEQSLEAGTTLGNRFRLEVKLGHLADTELWRAFDLKLHRPVVITAMDARSPRTPEILTAAMQAAVATDSRFVRVLDAVSARQPETTSFVVSEYAPGRTLRELLATGPLSALEAAWVVREIADAMTPMHAQGIFHERLSPETIIITATGNVKIVGLLMEAVLNPHEMHQATSWSEREATDIVDMGKILYACLVSRWPLGTPSAPASLAALPSESTRHAQKTWGLAAAPADGHGWLTPRQVQPGVSPALDVLCDQILSQQPRHDEVPVRSASEIYQALARVLGSADAAADLERRLRDPTAAAQRSADSRTAPAEPDLVSAGRTLAPESAVTRTSVDLPPVIDEEPAPAHAPSVEKSSRAHDPSNRQGESSQDLTGPDEDGYWSPQAAAGQWGRHDSSQRHRAADPSVGTGAGSSTTTGRSSGGPAGRASTGSVAEISTAVGTKNSAGVATGLLTALNKNVSSRAGTSRNRPARTRDDNSESIGRAPRHPRPTNRHWPWILVALTIAALVVGLVLVGAHDDDEQAHNDVPQATEPTIATVKDFDPQADGGNDEEHPRLVNQAHDGRATTAWRTLVYRGSANLGGLKPGVGLVVDLGTPAHVSSVTVTLTGSGTDISAWIPSNDTSRASMRSIKDWTKADGQSDANGKVTLDLGEKKTRYVLIYLTKLPSVSDGRYQGGISTITVQ